MKVQQALLRLFAFFFTCHLCNVLFWCALCLLCVVLLCLNSPFVYVLLKMCLIVLYINEFLCYCVILTCDTQRFHQANTFTWFKQNFNSFNVTKFYRHRDHSNKRYHWIKYVDYFIGGKQISHRTRSLWFNYIFPLGVTTYSIDCFGWLKQNSINV